MKKLALLIIAILLIVSLTACGADNGSTNNENINGNGNGNGNGTGDQQWAAYAFDQTVQPTSGGAGRIKSFTIKSVYGEDGQNSEFNIQGTYLGKETVNIEMQKIVMTISPPKTEESIVSISVECYKVKHRVAVVQNKTGEDLPAWADITVWIPVDELEAISPGFGIYPKATYIDSDGRQGDWSYYLTKAMQDEMQNPPAGKIVTYDPVLDEDFYGYDEWILFGLYGWTWTWFGVFAEGGQQFKEGSWSGGGCNFTCAKVSKTIGNYTFAAWSLDASCIQQGDSGQYKGIFSLDLPLPIYIKIVSSGEGGTIYFEYTLTDIELQ